MKKNILFPLLALFLLVAGLVVAPKAHAVEYHYNTDVRGYLDQQSIPQTVFVGEIGKIYPKKDGVLLEAEYAFRYTVSDPSILSINDNGRFVAHQPGQVVLQIRMTGNGEDPRFDTELKNRGITPAAYDPATPYPAYEATITVLPAEFQPIYRLYNQVSKEHLYTTDGNEKAALSAKKDWQYEGVAWRAQTEDQSQPVYRLYHHGIGKHLFTKDQNEYHVLQGRGWKSEGIVFYAKGEMPVYRLYLAGLKKHLYTTDENEKNVLQTRGWRYEGVAWYSIP